jgi:hypothetical protein
MTMATKKAAKSARHDKKAEQPASTPRGKTANAQQHAKKSSQPGAAAATAAATDDTAVSAPAAAKKTSARSAAKAGPKRLSALDAAAKVLQERGVAMNCKDLIAEMAAKGYWTSPGGRTPESTLYAAILRETKTRGEQARFRKSERGKFAYTGK